jgi:hypothetical protein
MRWGLWVAAVVVLALLPRPAWAQLSPGPLSAPHASLEGATKCFQCHERGAGVVDARCLGCHTEIAWSRGRGRGLHARVQGTPCAKCHPDHAGREFQLVRWDEGTPERFDHRRTGYPLAGKHASLACAKCHQPRMHKSGAAGLLHRRDRARSWLGLEPACAACHADPHAAELGADCARCHGQDGWKPAAGFDHGKSAYPLTGRHAKVACVACHPASKAAAGVEPASARRFKGVPHGDCVTCHRDPHAGRLAGACSRCHATSDFKAVDTRGFQHERTRFALKGKHAALACARCHDRKSAWGEKPAFVRCTSCHQDAHRGQATLAGRAADCAACHDERGWVPSTYTVVAHQASAYPLEGRHAKAACAGCHLRSGEPGAVAALGSSRVVMRPGRGQCADCHVDPHRGRFLAGGARPQKDGCRACHSLQAFIPAQLGAAGHAPYGFALEGAHRAVPCMECHPDLKGPRAASTLRGAEVRASFVAEAPGTCAGCHKNPHGDQFAKRRPARAGVAGDACDSCHGLESFEPAVRFDHDRDAAFRLGGAHARVACAACHRPVSGAPGGVRVVYCPTPARCEECHVVRRGPDGNTVVVPKSAGKS